MPPVCPFLYIGSLSSLCQLLLYNTSFNAVSFADHKHYHSNKRSYHEIRRTSDRLCKEHGLSVIVPGQDKGKSYIEHQAARNVTSYKAKLKAAIDRLIPSCSDFEDLLFRLEREGYEIKRGKFISCRASDQERFARMKTLGIDYTEEAITARIAGGSRPSRHPKQRDGRISLLIDIQNNIKAQQSAGFTHWAKLNNLKQAAKTMNFLTEHGIDSYAQLTEKLSAITDNRNRVHAEIKAIESRQADLALVMKHSSTYRKLKPIYEQYRRSGDKEKSMRGHESEIILFEASARELKRLNAVPLPSTEKLNAELSELAAKKRNASRGIQICTRRSTGIRNSQTKCGRAAVRSEEVCKGDFEYFVKVRLTYLLSAIACAII